MKKVNARIKIFIGILIAGIILTGGYIKIKADRSKEAIKLLSVPEKVKIQNRTYILEAKLWRDFMPVSPPDGKPLIVLAWVTANDLSEFPSSLKADRIWVINGKKLWQGKISDEKRPKGPGRKHQLEIISRGGPKWGPGVNVDVVVSISDEKNRRYMLRATDQEIHRTE